MLEDRMTIETMKLALEALENLQGLCSEEGNFIEQLTIWTPEAMYALRTAIAEAEKPTATHITWNEAGDRVVNGVAEKQEPVAWVREHELPLAPGDAFSWVETRVHKTPLYTTPPAAPVQPEQERECLRKAQEDAVMPLIGPLLDAWESCSETMRGEQPEVDKYLRKINRAMEDATPPAAQRQPLTEAEIADVWDKQLFDINDMSLAIAFVRDIEAVHGITGEKT
jgi:hypothetical protein